MSSLNLSIETLRKEIWNQALASKSKGLYDEAIECYNKILEIDSGSEEAWNSKGIVLFKKGSYIEAIACCDKALEINPDFKEALNGKGYALLFEKKFEEAQDCFNEALAIDYQYSCSIQGKGLIEFYINSKKKADDYFKRAGECHMGEQFKLYCQRGKVLNSFGAIKEAREAFQQALNIRVDYIPAVEALEKLLNENERGKDSLSLQTAFQSIRPRMG